MTPLPPQPWFDGNLGMAGGSYFGFTQLAVAHQRPAILKTIVPMVTPSNIYSLFYSNGLVRADITTGWSLSMYQPDQFVFVSEGAFVKAALHWPLIEGDDVTVGDIPWYNEWLTHTFDDGYYDRYIPDDVIERIDLPMLMISGWFDVFAKGQLKDFEIAQAKETILGQTRIIVGPWTHGIGFTEQHDIHFPDSGSLLSFFDLIIEWFDYYLKEINMTTDWGPVKIYNPGLGSWEDRATLWSPDRVDFVLYLNGDQGASSCQPKGALSTTAPYKSRTITYTYDPLDPIYNFGGALLIAEVAGCKEQQDHCDREDVLTFESSPFEHDITIDGGISLFLRDNEGRW